MADGMNNLSDASSNIVSWWASNWGPVRRTRSIPTAMPGTNIWPGWRFSVMILVIGVELLKESFGKVLHPTEVQFGWLTYTYIYFPSWSSCG